MPGKYQPLADWLARQPADVVTLPFAQVEALLGAALPPTARAGTGWWRNDPRHAHARLWLAAGWEVATVDRLAHVVVYRRVGGP
jgi:hypothetical protein